MTNTDSTLRADVEGCDLCDYVPQARASRSASQLYNNHRRRKHPEAYLADAINDATRLIVRAMFCHEGDLSDRPAVMALRVAVPEADKAAGASVNERQILKPNADDPDKLDQEAAEILARVTSGRRAVSAK